MHAGLLLACIIANMPYSTFLGLNANPAQELAQLKPTLGQCQWKVGGRERSGDMGGGSGEDMLQVLGGWRAVEDSWGEGAGQEREFFSTRF